MDKKPSSVYIELWNSETQEFEEVSAAEMIGNLRKTGAPCVMEQEDAEEKLRGAKCEILGWYLTGAPCEMEQEEAEFRDEMARDAAQDLTEVIVTKKPKCDICEREAEYDARTTFGPWANLCEVHFTLHGIGLGTGKGQKLVV